MECIFDKEKECPLGGKIPLMHMGRFCQACIGRGEMRKALQSMTVMRAQLILGLLAMFPKNEEKAKETYQRVMKFAEEW